MARRTRSERGLLHSLVPFGLNERKPRHFLSMLRVLWQNRHDLPHAWRVLTRGVCDGCALGTSGLRDWTIDGIHLCMVRLELLQLNTMGTFDPDRLADVAQLRRLSSRALRDFGRLGWPMRRRRGEPGFTRVDWTELWRDVGERWRRLEPDRTAMFVTSRGITNEVYYTAQKVMRFLGSNNVDNSARLCHSPSTSGLKSTIGVAATTCSYKDWYEADLIVFLGSNPANDQPVAMKYLLEARRRGTRVIVVNPYEEPGMARYWVPSDALSAVFGTKMTDRFQRVNVGGDTAFLNAVQKVMLQRGAVAGEFIRAATTGFSALSEALEAQSFDDLCRTAGVTQQDVETFADEISAADRGILVWSMGITQHVGGADTVRAIANLALLREWVGRDGCGLMPIRGHSGVQGGAEMGAYATAFPGGLPITADHAARFSKLWGFTVPDRVGIATVPMLEAAGRGEIDALYCIGGNFLETMPEPSRIEEALSTIGLRLHSDIVVSSQMLVEPADVVYLLPAKTRYEQVGGGTETSTERRVIFSPEIPGHDLGETRAEWQMLLELAQAVQPQTAAKLRVTDARSIREDIAQAVPAYAGIEKLRRQGDQFQWGGRHLCAGREFPTEDGKAHFQPVQPHSRSRDAGTDGRFRLATRRGKQFNSMIQADVDPINGAARDHVLLSRADAARLSLRLGDPIRLRSAVGTFDGRAFPTDVAPGTLQGHWPEVNHLIVSGPIDVDGGVPDYNADVTLEVIR